jgi:hypothetical protein
MTDTDAAPVAFPVDVEVLDEAVLAPVDAVLDVDDETPLVAKGVVPKARS